jgi:hypothetical protein
VALGQGTADLRGFEADRLPSRPDCGSHKIVKKEGWSDYPSSFHDSEELGPVILAKISKKTGLKPEDL